MRIPLASCLIAVVVAVVALAQTDVQDQTPRIRSLSHAIHAVEDLDTTLAFYREAFGLSSTPNDFPNPAVPLLTDAPGVTLRLSMMPLPGAMRFELTHFKGLERKPGRAAYTDPGAGSIVLYVRDLGSPGRREEGERAHRHHWRRSRRDRHRQGQGPLRRSTRS